MGKITCYFCSKKCRGDVLKVEDKYFHKECFTCKVCHKKLENIQFFFKDDGFYCTQDYTTYCASECYFCQKKIIGEVVTALSHTFHKICFKCSKCQRHFVAGDKVSMKNKEFLCISCSGGTINNSYQPKSLLQQPINNINPVDTTTTTTNSIIEQKIEGNNQIELADSTLSLYKDADSSSVPLKRKPMTSNGDTKSVTFPRRPQSTLRTNGSLNHSTTLSESHNYRHSSTSMPRHFHIPQGNNRSWMYSPSVVGTKNHPLALSTSHLERGSNHPGAYNDPTSPTHQPNNIDIKRLSSYPNGTAESDSHQTPIERDDFPAPPALNVIQTEKSRRKIQNPTVEALSAGTTPRIRKTRSSPQHRAPPTVTHNRHSVGANAAPSSIAINEALKRSTTDCSTFTSLPLPAHQNHKPVSTDYHNISNHSHHNPRSIPQNPISASRCPSASCEPLIPPRYNVHLESSPSRNDEYFRTSHRHLGYSMEYVNSTSRSFLSDTIPGARHSYNPKSLNNEITGLRKVRPNQSARSIKVGFYPSSENISYSNDQESNKNIMEFIPYEKLRQPAYRKMKRVDRAKLETYLTDDEFEQVFQLSKPSFYRLPEWKRNDLKRRVDLF